MVNDSAHTQHNSDDSHSEKKVRFFLESKDLLNQLEILFQLFSVSFTVTVTSGDHQRHQVNI